MGSLGSHPSLKVARGAAPLMSHTGDIKSRKWKRKQPGSMDLPDEGLGATGTGLCQA